MGWSHESAEVIGHYVRTPEEHRVAGVARFEVLRIQELLARLLPPVRAALVDIGGGPGTHALPLAAAGHEVHLLDPVRGHVDRARERQRGSTSLASAHVGEARNLPFDTGTLDVALMFGPLYHLTDAAERRAALMESWRVLKPGGILLATGISRFASLMIGLTRGVLADIDYTMLVQQDLSTGQHHNPTRHPNGFTRSCCHTPEQLASEVTEAGFGLSGMFAVDGPAGRLTFQEREDPWLDDDRRREQLLAFVRRVEVEPSMLGASPQLLAFATKEGAA